MPFTGSKAQLPYHDCTLLFLQGRPAGRLEAQYGQQAAGKLTAEPSLDDPRTSSGAAPLPAALAAGSPSPLVRCSSREDSSSWATSSSLAVMACSRHSSRRCGC